MFFGSNKMGSVLLHLKDHMRRNVLLSFSLLFVLLGVFVPTHSVSAQSPENQYIERAKVVAVLSQSIHDVPGTNTSATYQSLSAEVLEGKIFEFFEVYGLERSHLLSLLFLFLTVSTIKRT